MELQRVVSIRSKLSLAVNLIDAYTGGAPVGSRTEAALTGVIRKPVRKDGGTYVFGDLAEGTYRLVVTSEHYYAEAMEVRLGEGASVIAMPLKPLPSYPFPAKATLLRASLRDAEGRPHGGVAAAAALTSEDCCRGRLAGDEAEKGAVELAVANITSPIRVGDAFILQGRSAKETELCEIASVSREAGRFGLASPLQFGHKRGANLMPVIRTRSDERGELVMAFPAGRMASFEAELLLETDGRRVTRQVRLDEGEMLNLGSLTL